MDKDKNIEKNIEKGAKELLDFLKNNYPSYHKNIVKIFFSSMLKEKNEKFMDIYNDYDYTSFVQFDIFLDLFSEYCKKIIPFETIKEFKFNQLIQNILKDEEILIFKRYKNLDSEFIFNSIKNSNFISESYYNNIFSYHMGYNDSYEVHDVIKKIILHILGEEEYNKFKEHKEKLKK